MASNAPSPWRLLDFPPTWLLACFALQSLAANTFPLVRFQESVGLWLGRGLIAVSLAFMAWCGVWFWRKRTSIIPRNRASALIVEGPYRFSRNPIYLGDVGLLMGYALTTGALSPWLVIPAFVVIIEQRFIRGEEAHLQAQFGPEFTAYRRRTGRWFNGPWRLGESENSMP